MSDHFAELAVLRVFRIDVRRVDVAGHHREQHDVLLGERSRQRGAVTDLYFVERPVLEVLHEVEVAHGDEFPVMDFLLRHSYLTFVAMQ